MKLFEYEAKQILRYYGATTPRGVVVAQGEDPLTKIREAGLAGRLVVKAQVLVAGRGKAGGVKLAPSPEEAAEIATRMLGSKIKGVTVRKVLIEEAVEHDREWFASITVDRASRDFVLLLSTEGGVDIEEVARERPEAIIKYHIPPERGLLPYKARELGKEIGLRGRALNSFASTLVAMYRAFVDHYADLVESNPFTVVKDRVVLLDARMIIDDSAIRLGLVKAEQDPAETGELSEWEVRARRLGLNFVELDGYVGIVGNGAGLTMATMDLVKHFGGEPANFLDIGGGASAEVMKKALSILMEYPKARSIFINIFGGITRCDEVAKGVVQALREVGSGKPVVIRLVGTNEEEGRAILEGAGIKAFTDPAEAAKEAIRLGGGE